MANVYRLYIFETLVREGGSMPINSLWSCLSNRFPQDAEFLQIIGQNVSDFEIFLRSNTSLFVVDGFTVSLADEDTTCDYYLPEKPSHRYRVDFRELQSNDVNFDSESVKYFKSILLKRPGAWFPINILVNYLAQAPMRIRIGLGTRNELISFLYRYPRVFKVTCDGVTLTDDAANSVMMLSTPVQLRQKKRVSLQSGFKERSNSMRMPLSAANTLRHSMIFRDRESVPESMSKTPAGRPLSTMLDRTPITEPVINAYSGRKNNIISLSIPEFKTISWLRSMVFSSNKYKETFVPIAHVMRRLVEAPDVVHATVGTTQVEFIEFINKHPALAVVEGETAKFKPTDRLHLIIVENQPQELSNGVNLNGKKGCVFCVSKLWGIIDLGYHEHVFFDRSLFKNVTDLQKHFKVGELLYFNAVLAAKESRAKWRATRVWKESDILATRLAIKNNPTACSKLNLFGEATAFESESLFSHGKRSSNMLIDPLVLKQAPELTQSLTLNGVNLSENITCYASVRLAAPWEVSAIIAQSSEIFPDVETTAMRGFRKPLVEVHAGQSDSGTEVRTSSSESSCADPGKSNNHKRKSSTNDLSKLVMKMNVDAEPVVPAEWLRKKSPADKKGAKGPLLICAEQSSQTENLQIKT
ncbi:hypothetical protein Ciccas_005339 [Cichlidogyrus casuarinus]|uniref:Egal-1 winged helix domain-containing protein n=1 Tax=Cichlidogyrus casuarinus TaxID=1844966 RepID=A0ABD2Q9V8_9PLAT